jgi:hypothetical protein
MPGVSGVTVVTNACAFYHYTRGCGRYRSARHSLRPLFSRDIVLQSSGANRSARMLTHTLFKALAAVFDCCRNSLISSPFCKNSLDDNSNG